MITTFTPPRLAPVLLLALLATTGSARAGDPVVRPGYWNKGKVPKDALLDYLREGRPQLAVRRYRRGFQTDPRQYREVFLRCRTPAGVLQSTAIAEAFQAWSRRSGLKIPFQGVHCLRHSYALHLLRSGLSLKTIGDLLGHRSSESTCVYLRLATDDLREVALSFPASASVSPAQENAR